MYICLRVLNERQTRLNLNKAVKGKVKTIINKNEKNEGLMTKYIAEILSGYSDIFNKTPFKKGVTTKEA